MMAEEISRSSARYLAPMYMRMRVARPRRWPAESASVNQVFRVRRIERTGLEIWSELLDPRLGRYVFLGFHA